MFETAKSACYITGAGILAGTRTRDKTFAGSRDVRLHYEDWRREGGSNSHWLLDLVRLAAGLPLLWLSLLVPAAGIEPA